MLYLRPAPRAFSLGKLSIPTTGSGLFRHHLHKLFPSLQRTAQRLSFLFPTLDLVNLLPLVWRRLNTQFSVGNASLPALDPFLGHIHSHMRIRSLKNKPAESFQLCHHSLLLGSQVFYMETTSLGFAAFTCRMCSMLKCSARIRSNSLTAYSSAYIRMQLLEACCSALS